MIAYEAFANPASTRKSMCDSTRLDTIELILINLSNYQTCHDCTIMLLRRPGEQDYSTYPNTSLRDAFRACNSLPGTYGRRHTVQWFHRGNRTVVSRPHAFILGQQRRVWVSLCVQMWMWEAWEVCEGVNTAETCVSESLCSDVNVSGVRGVWGCEYSRASLRFISAVMLFHLISCFSSPVTPCDGSWLHPNSQTSTTH